MLHGRNVVVHVVLEVEGLQILWKAALGVVLGLALNSGTLGGLGTLEPNV